MKSVLGTDLVYYAQYASERSVDPQAAVRGELYAGRLTFFVDESYLNTRERLNYSIDVRARHRQNNLSGGVAYRATTGLAIEAAASTAWIRFDGDEYFNGQRLKETLDRDTQVFSVTARHRRNGLTTFGLRYENQVDRFPLSPIRDTDSFRVMPGVELRPRALFNGSAWVGYRRFDPKSALSAVPVRPGLAARAVLHAARRHRVRRHLRPRLPVLVRSADAVLRRQQRRRVRPPRHQRSRRRAGQRGASSLRLPGDLPPSRSCRYRLPVASTRPTTTE